ncbi:iron complex outermembrane recepter protein [Catalinimonas alkaloidigena]|uniref:Iron complex outermembrane recepter protein n=2 Tax=Catalinimonas alkaloidigena TaxID=1075417 RepID=A0A1G9GII9_9BACT|nr:iron complex outermembrane recepter protein [Catalinimonas alkaloidigena]
MKFTMICWLGWGMVGWAQTAAVVTPADTLKEVTVSADYNASRETPITFQNLNSNEINQRYYGQEPALMLTQTPSVTAYSDAGSALGYAYFRLRGLDQTRLNITLDGVPLNEPEDQGAYFSNYPDLLNSVRRMQVQRGVGTSQNGAASYAGSLQLESPSLFGTAGGEVGAGYGSFQTYRVYGKYQTGDRNQTGAYVRASYLHSDGYKYHAGNTSGSVFYSAGHYRGRHSWKLTGFTGRQANQLAWIGVPKEVVAQDPRTNANSRQEDDAFLQSLLYLQHGYRVGEHGTWKSCVYYNYLDGNYDFDLNNFLGLPATDALYNYAFRSHFAGVFSNYTVEKTKYQWVSGFHANTYVRRHLGSETNSGTLYTNRGFRQEVSGFSKLVYRLPHWTLFGDLQLRYTDFVYRGDVAVAPLRWTFLNPKFGVTRNLGAATLYYSLGRTGREPTRNDLLNGEDNLLADSLGQPLLNIVSAEYVVDHELGLRLPYAKGHLQTNLYYLSFRNEIVLNGQFGPNGLPLHSDVARSFRSGLEVEATYRLGRVWELAHQSTFSYNQIREGEARVAPVLTPQVLVNQELRFAQGPWQAGLRMRYQGTSYLDFANEETLPAFVTWHAEAAYRWGAWQVRLRVNNLTNVRYFSHGYIDWSGTPRYFVQAPRHWYSSVTWNF